MKLCVAVPVGGPIPFQVAASLAALHSLPFPVKLIHFAGGTISMARNELTAAFLASDCTDLLFIDADIQFSPEHIARLVSHSKQVVGGCYCERVTGASRVVACMQGGPDADGLAPVEWIGAGFLKVSRDVFGLLEAEDYDTPAGEPRKHFWPCGIFEREGKRLYHSEDVGFFRLCHRAGIQPYADTQLLVNHIGTASFPTPDQLERLTN